MGDLIQIEHPGPVRHRPPRAREDQTDLFRMVTPVLLRDLAFSETDEGPAFLMAGNRRVRTRILGGEVWRAVGRDAWDKPAPKAPDAERFKAWLRGEPEAAKLLDRSDTASVFASTPLVARTTKGGSLVRPHAERPEPRMVLADWRESARAALADFVSRDVAIVGGLPMTRMRGPLAYYDKEFNSFRLARFPGTWTVNHEEGLGIFLRIDRVRAMARLLHASDRDGHGPWTEGSYAGAIFARDDDIAVTGAEGIRKSAEAIIRQSGPWERTLAPETRRRVLDLSALATIGFRPEDVPGAFDLLRQVCVEMRRDPTLKAYWLAHYEAYVARVAEPIIADSAIDVGADVESLAALAP